jgi:tetratricopeptide (TPR) repeat protein
MATVQNQPLRFLVRRAPIILLLAFLLSVAAYEVFLRTGRSRSVFPSGKRADEAKAPEPDTRPRLGEGYWGRTFRNLPWQVVRINRQFVPRNDIRSLAAEIEFADDVPSTCNVFFVPIDSHGRDAYFYFGAVTNGFGRRKGDGLHCSDLGHCFVFSRWGDKSPESCRPVDGGYFWAADNEGDHVSVRLVHPWGRGRYTFTLRTLPDDRNRAQELWVGAYVYSHQTKEELFVGALRFPGPTFDFAGNVGGMVEVYGNPEAFPKSLPSTEVSIGNVRINDKAQKAFALTVEYPADVPHWARAEGRSEAPEKLQKLFPDDPAAVAVTVRANASVAPAQAVRAKITGPKDASAGDGLPANAAPPSDEECRRVALEIQTAVQTGNVAEYARLLGFSDIFKRALDELAPLHDEQSHVLFIDPAGFGTVFAQRMVDEVGRGGTYRFVHVHHVDGKPRALFRVRIGSTDDWNYHAFSLIRRPDGSAGVGDATFLTAGDTLSALTERMALALVHADELKLRSAGRHADELILQSLKAYGAMSRSFAGGDYAETLKAYAELPAGLQEQKNICANRVRAARHVGGEEYAKAIEHMRRLYPNDVSTDFLSIFYLLSVKQYEEALAAIDRTDKALGGDPGMDVMRGLAHLHTGSFEKARECLKRAIDQEPTLEEAYLSMTMLTVKQRDFDETVEWLIKTQSRLHIAIGDLTTRPEYADFIKSPQYQKWLEWRKNNPPANRQPVAPP